ncbi:MAG TPA: hypothetical protein VF530_13650 [Planctomycetota bacterium]
MQLHLSHPLAAPGATSLAPGELFSRMQERFAWAVGRGHAVALLACEPLGLEALERRSPGLAARVLGALAVALGPAFAAAEALVAREDAVLVLLVGPDPRCLEAACRAWLAGLKELRVDGVDGPLRLQGKLGYAVSQPGQRLFLDTLLQVAREGLRVARCRGPGACVHTMLYNLVQARLEGERGVEGLAVTASEPLGPGMPAREPGAAVPLPHAPHPARTGTGAESRAPVAAGTAPAPGVPSSDRERDLLAALAAQRRENETLQARLRILERGPPPDGAARDAPEAQVGADASAQDRIDRLERRLAKLRALLVESEARLARAVQAEAVDPGVASCYRTVQGLAADAPQHDQKAALMEQIFAANLELHEILRRRRAS